MFWTNVFFMIRRFNKLMIRRWFVLVVIITTVRATRRWRRFGYSGEPTVLHRQNFKTITSPVGAELPFNCCFSGGTQVQMSGSAIFKQIRLFHSLCRRSFGLSFWLVVCLFFAGVYITQQKGVVHRGQKKGSKLIKKQVIKQNSRRWKQSHVLRMGTCFTDARETD